MEPPGTGGGAGIRRRAAFSTTRWGLVVAAAGWGSPDADRALDDLCRRYWYPLYAFVRRRGYSAEDAEDLTQEFFARLLARGYLARAEAAKGRFRSYLLAGMRNLLSDESDRAGRAKRGGGVAPVSIDGGEAESRYCLEPADHTTPEALFERCWTATLLARVAERLGNEYRSAGKGVLYEQLTEFRLDSNSQRPYAAAAAELGISESAVRSAIHRLRQRHAQLVREEIAATVKDPAEVENEIRYLLAVVGR